MPPAYVGGDEALARMRGATARHGIIVGSSSPSLPAELNPTAAAFVPASWDAVLAEGVAPVSAPKAIALQGVSMGGAQQTVRKPTAPQRPHPYHLRELVRRSRARAAAFRRSRQEVAANKQPAEPNPTAAALAEAAVSAAVTRAIRRRHPSPPPPPPEPEPHEVTPSMVRERHGDSIWKAKWPRPPPWTPLSPPPSSHPLTRRQQQRGNRKHCTRSVTALLARVRRSDAVHLKKGDETGSSARSSTRAWSRRAPLRQVWLRGDEPPVLRRRRQVCADRVDSRRGSSLSTHSATTTAGLGALHSVLTLQGRARRIRLQGRPAASSGSAWPPELRARGVWPRLLPRARVILTTTTTRILYDLYDILSPTFSTFSCG